MSTVTWWIAPAFFSDEDKRTDPIILDLTNYLKSFLANEVWKRKIDYGFNPGLKNTNSADINSVTATLHPRFFSGGVNPKRLQEIITATCGSIPSHLKLKSYKDWPYRIGLIIIEVTYKSDLSIIPSKEDLKGFLPRFEESFIEIYHRKLAVLKEVAAFLLASLHLSFPTRSYIGRNDDPLVDGMFLLKSGTNLYGEKVATNAFMHEILVERSKLQHLIANMNVLATVWHYNLWPLKRYLAAVESDQLSMDNLLDLLYALEGLFEKNTSSEFIKLMCLIHLCKSIKEANELKPILDIAFQIRNEIVHGGRSYDPFEKVKLAGREALAQDIYWNMKVVVAVMILKATSKMINRSGMTTLRFNADDFINSYFTKP